MKTSKQILIETRNLLSDPSKWTRRTLARDKNLKNVSPYSDHATCFCMYGALQRVSFIGGLVRTDTGLAYDEARSHLGNVVAATTPYPKIDYFNDHPNTTHEDVLKILDKAIETI